MRNILTLPLRFVHYLIRVQEIKSYNFYVLLAFSVFTGMARGLEEILIFAIPLKNSEVLTFLHFYLSLAIILTAGISAIGGLPWQKVLNVILVGIFLGIFPPLIDSLLSGETQVFYGFFFLHDWREIPWLGYKPEFNFPLGECITIWLSIFFSGYYVYYKSRSPWRFLVASGFAYAGFMLFGSFLPMLVAYLTAGYIPSIQTARALDESLLRSIVYYNAFAQIALATFFYLLLRRALLLHLLRRSLHGLPFVVMALLGAAMAGNITGHVLLAAALVFWGAWMNLVQNRLYDLQDDRADNREQISQHDVDFFNVTYLLAVVAIFFTGNQMVIPILLMYPLTFLYNHPAYRGKKKFPTNLKIEGVWGVGAFVAGALATGKPLPSAFPSLALLVFGGFSLIAALKDAKDVRNDKRSGTQTLYIKLISSGIHLRTAHRIIFTLCMLAFLVPPVIFAYVGVYPLSVILALSTLGAAIFLGRKFPNRRWFAWFLVFTFCYLMVTLLGLLQQPQILR